jgi:DNA-binding XRE family transcriptional regulator
MSEIHPIKAFRESQTPPISQEALGGRIGVTRFTILRWEDGSPVDVDLLPAVSRETGIPAKVLRPDLAKQFMDEPVEASQ